MADLDVLFSEGVSESNVNFSARGDINWLELEVSRKVFSSLKAY